MIRDIDIRTNGRAIGVFWSIVIHLALISFLFSYREQVRSAVAEVVGRGSLPYAGRVHAPEVQETWTEAAGRVQVHFAIENWIDHLWQSTLFAIAAGLLTIPFRRNRARVRYALWFVASIKFLIPFTLLMDLGSRLIGPSTLQDLAASPLVAQIHAPGMSAVWPASAMTTTAGQPWRGVVVLVVLFVWSLGFVAITLSRFRLWWQLRDTVDGSRPIRLTLHRITLPAAVRVRAADGLLEPGVVGWLQPILLMPADIDQHLTPPQIETIVAHELCHVRRYDNLTAAIHMVTEAIFWFHPLVWWIGARLVNERERACDEHVLRTTAEPASYAQGILNVCKRYTESRLAIVSGVGSADVPKRIEAILANHIGESIGPWKTIVLGTTIALMGVVSIGVGAASAPRQRPAAPPLDRGIDFNRLPYTLVLADPTRQLGPNLIPTLRPDANCNCDPTVPGGTPCLVYIAPGQLRAEDVTMPFLARLLAREVHAPVDDRTGLTGRFDVRLTWRPDTDVPSFAAALEQQLGLRMIAR